MLQVERQEEILQLLRQKAAWRVAALAAALFTSEATVRRDLAALEAKGLVRRVYGGVVLEEENMPLDARRQAHTAAKEEIAERAAALVTEGMTVFLDASSTAWHMVPHLSRLRELTVVTNSARVIEEMAGGRARLFGTGGLLLPRNMAFVGSIAEATLQNLYTDIAFVSGQGVGEDGEITDFSEEETSLRRVALARTAKKVFLCDASKAGKKYFFRLGNVADMDAVITDAAFPQNILKNTPSRG